MSNNKPKHFIILKIIGIFLILVAVYGLVLIFTGFGDFESNKFMIGIMLTPFAFVGGITCTVMGFKPEIAKMHSKSFKYIQEENKEDLKEIANTYSDITKEAVNTITKAVIDGKNQTMYCKHCGKEIDKDSKFCSHCGKLL